MPMGKWPDFQSCVDEMQDKQGYDEETAKKVCGKIKAEQEDGKRADACCADCAQGWADDVVGAFHRVIGGALAMGMRQRTDADAPAGRQHVTLSLDPAGIDRYTRSVRVVASTPNPVPGQAAVTKWDLERFRKNPVVLWAHDSTALPIGVVTEIIEDDPAGLVMRIRFASEKVSELAEQVWNGLLEGIIKAVSVGFDPPATAGAAAQLVELSVVPVGLDEDAGTDAVNPAAEPSEEEMTARVKSAASELARHLHRLRAKRMVISGNPAAAAAGGGEARAKGSSTTLEKRADGSEVWVTRRAGKPDVVQPVPDARFDLGEGEVLRMDVAPLRLDALEDTPSGGKKMRARLGRTGVLMYRDPRYPDGWRREFRPPNVMFNADSMRSMEGATIIDVKDHTGLVTPDTWKRVALGHVHAVRRDGDFLDSEIHINDRATLDALQRGERLDVSSGYKCRLLEQPGEHRGERYDVVQTDVVYNHVALCPPNGGRAGPQVGVRADANDHNLPHWGVSHWSTEDKMKIRFDGREMDYGSKEHLDAIDAAHEAKLKALGVEHSKAIDAIRADSKAAVDKALAEKDGAVQALETFKADKAADEKKAKEKAEKRAEEEKQERSIRRKLEREAFRLLSRVKPMEDDEEGDDDAPDSEKDPKKKQAKRAAKLDSFFETATNREVMERVIKSLPGGEKFDGKDRDDSYVQARYDMLIENLGESLGNGLADVVREVHRHQERADGGEAFGGLAAMEAARKARDAAAAAAGKPVAPGK